MYKILGGDGKQYGPIPAETLRQWIEQGRANAETQVLAEGATSWQALGTIAEFAEVFGVAVAPEGVAGAAVADTSAYDGAARLANPAGWALLIVGILGIFLSLGCLAFYAIKGVPDNPLLERYTSQHASSGAEKAGQKIGTVAGAVFSGLWSAFVTFAGVKLRRLESWGVVLAGAIMAAIPCCGGQILMCFLGLPVGIWVIVVICQSKVKGAFS